MAARKQTQISSFFKHTAASDEADTTKNEPASPKKPSRTSSKQKPASKAAKRSPSKERKSKSDSESDVDIKKERPKRAKRSPSRERKPSSDSDEPVKAPAEKRRKLGRRISSRSSSESESEAAAATTKPMEIGSDESPEIPRNISEEAQDFLKDTFNLDTECRPTANKLLQHAFVSTGAHAK
ncbi:hypothetical protein SYNPS1DRAFT_26737 [Syncephalis pseudoplumigaleata]|uniref:Protein kinase domain-containing protein n=1 Tax=Syncephalis pseudoplumigaleata TaxID=1712513 RepID=A0A4P9Z4V1_9FUNG|nr:hypothetical protein SYNPS1DRAFT_26737 [Syncephalis pseudoplumigaleata]|eukprot:RKP27624.1 hypothetical protein SYNPS1DRAFT_26737 [Syncephalis pseudoplumigaleata]